MRYRMIERCRKAFPITMMCRCLKVSSSGYNDRRTRQPSKRQRDNERLLERMKTLYVDSDEVHGSPRISEELRYDGETCSLNRVARLRRLNALKGIPQKRRWRRKASGLRPLEITNHLGRDFKASEPNTKWVVDITFIENYWRCGNASLAHQ